MHVHIYLKIFEYKHRVCETCPATAHHHKNTIQNIVFQKEVKLARIKVISL